MRSLWIVLVLVAADARVVAQEGSVAELLSTIQRRRDRVDEKIFDALARHRNASSFKALRTAVGLLEDDDTLEAAFEAFRHYQGVDDVEGDAIAFLVDRARASEETVRHAAARGLAKFGEAAHPELEKLARRGRDEVVRAWAVQPLAAELARRGTPEAVELLVSNWRLGTSGMRSEARDAFPALPDPKVVAVYAKLLADRKYPDSLKTVILEIYTEVDGEAVDRLYLGALRVADPDVQYAAVRGLESRGRAEHEPQLEKLARSRYPSVRLVALNALARVRGGQPDWMQLVFNRSRDRDSVRRQSSAVAFAEAGTPEAIAALHALLVDSEHHVRAEAIQAVSSLRSSESVAVLVARMQMESKRLRVDIHRALRLLTGEDMGTTSARWLAWWTAEGPSFELPSLAEAEKREAARDDRREGNESRASFYGVPIRSDRVCFVMDTSGSMRLSTAQGDRRIDVAKNELAQALAAYPEGDLFNLIFFDSETVAWKRELEEMTDEVRGAAIAFAQEQRYGGKTALYGALMAACEDPGVDTIFLVTDGRPEGGEVNDVAQVRLDFLRVNSVRRVVVHGISIGRESWLLRRLAADTNGLYREVL